ncbi:MAG: hypothetical protein NZ928_00590 [Endomicrobia bacterium]|nr:hypothetical protein [Endomicrobiia bacterium]
MLNKFYVNKLVYLGSIFLFFFNCERQQKDSYNLIVDKHTRSITFQAELNQSLAPKYFVFYFVGYTWIKKHCIFLTSYFLRNLQTAVAGIDWQLWDDIYTKRNSPKLKIYILHNKNWYNLEDFIKFLNFNTYQTTFWGSPIYDEIILEKQHLNHKCVHCPLYNLEKEAFISDKKILNYQFIKPLAKDKIVFKIVFDK